MNLQGYLIATTNLSEYRSGAGWVEFGGVEGLTLTGGGTFDGRGAKAWPYNGCPTHFNCKLLPTVCTINHYPRTSYYNNSLYYACCQYLKPILVCQSLK